jgi:holliday junction DNA helicase RuvA
MIGYIEGKLLKREDDRILLLANQVGYEVILPTMVMQSFLEKEIGDDISLYIFFHQTERQPKPVLIGFTNEEEKAFFQLFISVEAIGPLKAVKALDRPVQEIAAAIESKDLTQLNLLKGVGSRTAKKIVATLQGKMEKFIISDGKYPVDGIPVANALVQPVMEVLVNQLGHKTVDAKRMIQEAMKRNRTISTAEELFDEVYRGDDLS